MGLTVRRLLDYFSVDDLQFLLSEINESQTGSRQELIERLIIEWSAHNKKWEYFLDYFDVVVLRQICNEYQLDKTGTRDLLIRRIKKEIKRNFVQEKRTPKHKNPDANIRSVNKHRRYVLAGIIIWFVIGISMSLLELNGYFLPVRENPIPISKEYFVIYQESEEERFGGATTTGYSGESKIEGQIILKSTLFSAGNQINILAEFDSEGFGGHDFPSLIKVLPSDYWVLFPDASNIVDGKITNKDLAIINMESRENSISGNGTIIYSSGGIKDIFVIDPRELDSVADLVRDRLPDAEFIYSIPENRNGSIIFHDSGFIEVEHTVFSKLLSKLETYQIEIKSADDLNSLDDSKKTGFGLWIGLTFGNIGIAVVFLRRH